MTRIMLSGAALRTSHHMWSLMKGITEPKTPYDRSQLHSGLGMLCCGRHPLHRSGTLNANHQPNIPKYPSCSSDPKSVVSMALHATAKCKCRQQELPVLGMTHPRMGERRKIGTPGEFHQHCNQETQSGHNARPKNMGLWGGSQTGTPAKLDKRCRRNHVHHNTYSEHSGHRRCTHAGPSRNLDPKSTGSLAQSRRHMPPLLEVLFLLGKECQCTGNHRRNDTVQTRHQPNNLQCRPRIQDPNSKGCKAHWQTCNCSKGKSH